MVEKYRLFQSSINTNSHEEAYRRCVALTKNYGGVVENFSEYTLNNSFIYHVKTATSNIIYLANDCRKIKKDEVDFAVKKLTGWENCHAHLLSDDEIRAENAKWKKDFKDIIIVTCPLKD